VSAISPEAVASAKLITDSDRLFATRMRAVREARGWSQRGLAARLGQHSQFIGFSERRARRIAVGEAQAICAVLGVDLAAMLDPDRSLASLLGGAE
jgi:transcriptional regulator with XRE-family HTH domain